MTNILMISLTQHLPKTAIKKIASHSSSIQEPDIDFQKQVDKQDQAEVTMKLEKAENIKLQNVSNVQTAIPHIRIIPESDKELAKKNYPDHKHLWKESKF